MVYWRMDCSMIDRPEYLAELEGHRDKSGLIKVVTGVRRCGKSTLLQLFQRKLAKSRISASRIINISLESIDNEELRDGKILYNHIKNKIKTDNMHYVFIDEVQLADNYEEAVNSLRLLKNVDLYVTGSNSNILSGKFATRWAGRYIEIRMLPLSFSEYASVFPNVNPDIIYSNYITWSSFPESLLYYEKPLQKHKIGLNENGVYLYLDAIYNSIMIKDVMLQQGIKEAALLERVVKCMLSNIGSETSLNKMVNMLNNDLSLRITDKKIYAATLESYMDGLLKSFVFYKAERRFIKGREYLKTNAKYYAVDAALRYYLLGNKGADSGHILENVVFLELMRRGYKVYVGKVGEKEVDFVAENANGIEYYQVAETARGRETLIRELSPLESINDNYKKILLTRDYEPRKTHGGIEQLNVLEWLLQ